MVPERGPDRGLANGMDGANDVAEPVRLLTSAAVRLASGPTRRLICVVFTQAMQSVSARSSGCGWT
jgi:hypothetical protein